MIAFHTPARLQDPTYRLWVELRFAREPISFAELVVSVTRDLQLTTFLLDGWERAGLIERTPKRGRDPETIYMTYDARALGSPPTIAAKQCKPRPQAPDTPRARIWHAIRILRSFDLVQVTLSADVSKPTARTYLRLLVLEGYLRRETGAHGEPVWRLLRDIGPNHPRIISRPIAAMRVEPSF